MGGGTGNKGGYKGDDAENMCGTTLEPDPRYQGCCSKIFRPGKVLRDVLIGLLVVLAIAVVIAVLFVVCFYLLPDTQSSLAVEESALYGKPIEKETNFNDLNEVELTDDTRYDVRPDVVLESIRKDQDQMDHKHETMDHEEHEHETMDHVELEHGTMNHEEHHHMGPTPELESGAEQEVEPEPETEPETKSEPEPEPEGAEHEHMHKEGEVTHDMTHEHMPNEEEMPHDHMHKEGEMTHDHMHTESEMPHEHMHTESEMPHEHMHTESEMPHEHMHTEGEMPHEHMHTESEMPHEHIHTDGEMNQDHMDKESKMADEHMHMEGEQDHDHMMDHANEGPTFVPSAPANDEVLEVVGSPALESTPSEMPTEFTIASVSSASGPGATVQILSSESEGTTEGRQEEGSLPPLFDTVGSRSNETGFEIFPGEGTGAPVETQPEDTPIDFIVPIAPIEEVEAPVLFAEENSTSEVVPAGSCRPRQLEMCSDLPFGLTSLPNWANDQTEKELNEGSLPFFRDVIVRSGCSPRARQYACGVLEPPCNSNGSIVPPCRTFCRSVAATCQEFIISGYSLSDVFDCEKFPDSADPSVCFDMTQAAGDEVLVEGLSPLPSIPIDPENPSSPRELSPEESPAPDYPDVPLVEDVPIDPVPVFGDYPAGTEEYVTASQDYPTESEGLAIQDPNILVPFVTEEEVGLPNEEPSVLDAWVDAGTEANPEEALMTTESSLATVVSEAVDGVAVDTVSPSIPVIICDHENFLCHDGSGCVALATVCDGFQQCTDGSDEFNCTQIDFSPVASSTDTANLDTETQTIFPEEELDGAMTTLPAEEIFEEAMTTEPLVEETTVTSSGCPELQCLDGTCLALSQLNNGFNDCADGTDEQDFGQLF